MEREQGLFPGAFEAPGAQGRSAPPLRVGAGLTSILSVSSSPSYDLLPFNECLAHQTEDSVTLNAPGGMEAINCHDPLVG